MKDNLRVRASHVNRGTSIPRGDLRTGKSGRQLRHPKLRMEARAENVTPYGGLSLAAALARRLRIPRELDRSLKLLRSHRPFTESDHVLTHAYNLFSGGMCIEDIATLQASEPVRRLLGTKRIPDPTTAGDFLRRFQADDLDDLDGAIDRVQAEVWRSLSGRRKQPLGIVDIDSHVRPVYGAKKEGADFSYKGGWAYHPLLISLAGSNECLRLVNRPGNVASSQDAEKHLGAIFSLLRNRFRRVVVRGDSAFFAQKIFDVCEENDAFFAVVAPSNEALRALADDLPEPAWKKFVPRTQRQNKPKRRRKRRLERRRRKARARGKRDLRLRRQWIADVDYRPARSKRTYRLIIRRQRIDETRQGQLFELWRYRFALTNIRDQSAQHVLDLTYERCDQENMIEQLSNGIAGMRMPTGSLLANAAYLRCARLAHNMKGWLAALALPPETGRWEWKRFRLAFVYVAARVVLKARQVRVILATSHRFHEAILTANARLQT